MIRCMSHRTVPKEQHMKKIALVAGGLVVANVVANIGINTLRASGGTIGGAAFLALPYLIPAPLNYMATPANAA